MQAYLNDPKLKTEFVAEIKRHQEADQILQGTYGREEGGKWRGCAVGCSIHSLNRIKGKEISTDNHKAYESELGMPEWLARLEDTIFEVLPKDLAMKWPLRFAEAVPVGADLEPVKYQFSAWLMKSNIERVLTLDIQEELKKQVLDAIRGVLALHEEAIKTGRWNASAAWSAAESAESAAWSAAESAAESASCCWSAAESAWSAARSAESAARSAARSAEYQRQADKLIELLEKA